MDQIQMIRSLIRQIKLQSMSQSGDSRVSEPKISILENLFNRAQPKSRYISESHIEDETNSIAKEIINGDIEVCSERGNFDQKEEKNDYEAMLRRRFIEQIEKQKIKLENKLGYIENSISSIHKTEFLKRRETSPANLNLSTSNIKEKQQEWRKQYKDKMKKISDLKKQHGEKEKEKEKQRLELNQKIKEEQVAHKKNQIMQNMKKIKERMDNRESEVKQSNQKLKQLLTKKQLYQKLQENYHLKEENILEERKKRLSEIRMLKKPINFKEILEHEQRILQIKRQKQLLREREKRMNDSRTRSYKPSYESSYYKKIAEHNQEIQETAKAKIEKMKQFSEHVKTKFVPEIDEKKRREIQEKLEKEQEAERKRVEREKQLSEKYKLKGHQYLELVKKLPKKKQNQTSKQSPQTDRTQYKNYLGVNRSTNLESSKPWKTILKTNGEKLDTALLLQFESEKLEQKLKRKQVYSKVMKIKDDGSIDQEYYEMVKAKLDLLAK